MKIGAFLAFVLCLNACKQSSNIVPADFLQVAPPTYPKIALYINQYTLGPHNGATLRPELLNWNHQSKLKFGTSTNQTGKPAYSATIEYLGRKTDGDIYSITITHPIRNGFETFIKEIKFSGTETKLYQDDQYIIGLRLDSPEKG